MEPKKITDLDPKLKEAYERVMGTSFAQPPQQSQPIAPQPQPSPAIPMQQTQPIQPMQSPQIQQQLVKYRDFVKAVVRQGNVLDKKFYISIPFSSLELGVASTISSVTKRKKGLPRPKAQIIERATTNLSPKRDHLIRLLARIGLRARQLTNTELVQLLFDFYNRGHAGTKAKLPLFTSSQP